MQNSIIGVTIVAAIIQLVVGIVFIVLIAKLVISITEWLKSKTRLNRTVVKEYFESKIKINNDKITNLKYEKELILAKTREADYNWISKKKGLKM